MLVAAWSLSRAPLCQTRTHTPTGRLLADGHKTKRLRHLEGALGEVLLRASVALDSRAGPAWLTLAPWESPEALRLPHLSLEHLPFLPAGVTQGRGFCCPSTILGPAHGEVGSPGGSNGKEPACQLWET